MIAERVAEVDRIALARRAVANALFGDFNPVPGKMRARTKPVAVSTPARPDPRLELVKLAVPAGQGRRAESLGSGAAAAPAIVEMLQKAGII